MADLISQIKGLDNITYDLQDKVSIFGQTNILPMTQTYLYSLLNKKATSQGITVTQEENGWFSVSGTKTSTSSGSVCLWPNPTGNNHGAPINDYFENINNNKALLMTVETEGTPFLEGTAYSNSTHIVIYGPSASTSWRLGGYTGLTRKGTYAQEYFSVIRYYIGASASGTVDGRFRVRFEKGNKLTDWSPASEDLATYSDETIEFFQ